MSKSTILSYFNKSSNSGWHKYNRRLHLLNREAMEKALDLIIAGEKPDAAIRKAKRGAK